MSKVYIKYNPYTIETELSIDGKKTEFKNGSHLQEWVEELPKYLVSKIKEKNYQIVFHGTRPDFEDVLEIADKYSQKHPEINFSVEYEKPTEEVKDKIHQITKIFEEIQTGDVKELKTPELVDAFKKAKSDEFPVNVVATMSAGKSTLINSLLGKEIMPSSQEACTAIITNIKDNDDEGAFKATVFDKNNKRIAESNNVTIEESTKWNSDENVSVINMEGDIPFVGSKESNSNLLLVDTPGPNNSRNEEHSKATWRMLGNSSKTLVLFILNATQLHTNDEKKFLTKVKKSMSVGGKQSRDRFIFVVNKLDEFNETENISKTLGNVRRYLEEDIGIENPNIYAASALNALQIRTILKDRKASELSFSNIKEGQLYLNIKRAIEIQDHHFEQYAPTIPSVDRKIEKRLSEAIQNNDEKEQALIYSGIPSVEEAIKLYVDKYAIPTKISNIVSTFKASLKKANVKRSLEKRISESEEFREDLKSEAFEINAKLEEAKKGESLQSKINKLSYSEVVRKEAKTTIKQAVADFKSGFANLQDEIDEDEARFEYENFVQEAKSIKQRTEVDLNELVQERVNSQIKELIEEYKNSIKLILGDSKIGMDIADTPIAFINADIEASIGRIEQMNVQYREEEYHFESQKKWYNPFTWLKKDRKVVDHEEKYFVAKEDFKSMFNGVEKSLRQYVEQITMYAQLQEEKTREFFEKEFEKLTESVQIEINKLNDVKSQTEMTEEEIKRNQKTLDWLSELEKKLDYVLSI